MCRPLFLAGNWRLFLYPHGRVERGGVGEVRLCGEQIVILTIIIVIIMTIPVVADCCW